MSAALKGRVVLVTGAGSSVGSEIVRHFSKLGASIVMTDGHRDLQIKVDKESSSSCLAIAGSLTKAMDVLNVISQTISKYRKLDALINCVDFPECGSSETESSLLQEFDLVMGATVRAVYHVVLLAAPHLIKSRGNVINIITLPETQSLANSVALASVEQLTKSLSLDLSPNGVCVNCITSDLLEVQVAETQISPRDIASIDNLAGPGERHGSGTNSAQDKIVGPRDIAETAAFLISDASSFTGAFIPFTRSEELATKDEIQKPSSAVLKPEKAVSNAKVENGSLSQKADYTSHRSEKVEKSKAENADHKENKAESTPNGKLGDSKIEKTSGQEPDKRAKEGRRAAHETQGQASSTSSTAVAGKHDVDNHGKQAKTANQGGHGKNESSKNESGKSAK